MAMARMWIVVCFCVLNIVYAQNGLETPCRVGSIIGTCVSLPQCEPYLDVLKQYPNDPRILDHLRKTSCGFDAKTPMVCCPQKSPATSTSTTERVFGRSQPASHDFIAAFPSPPACGVSKSGFGKVVGGENAKLGDLPWMAALGYLDSSNSTDWKCGGALISQRHVLTAAHCIQRSLYVVRLGDLDLDRKDDGATPIDIRIKNTIMHEQYSHATSENDIGLLVLQEDVKYTEFIRPICIPEDSAVRDTDYVGYNPFIAGWGKTSFNADRSSHLQVLQLPVLSNDVCEEAFSSYQRAFDERVLCAGFITGGKDSCDGDSGGPLMQPLPSNFTSFFYTIGIISYGLRVCASAGYPGVYTRVTNYIPWLQTHVLGATLNH